MTGGIKSLAMSVLRRYGEFPTESQLDGQRAPNLRLPQDVTECYWPRRCSRCRQIQAPRRPRRDWGAWLRQWEPPKGARVQ